MGNLFRWGWIPRGVCWSGYVVVVSSPKTARVVAVKCGCDREKGPIRGWKSARSRVEKCPFAYVASVSQVG